MTVIEESIIIERPRAEVFDYATDSERVLEWNRVATEYSATPTGAVTADTHVRGVSRVLGRDIRWAAKVADLRAGALVRWESTEADVPFTDYWLYEDVDGGTRVTFHQEFPSVGGPHVGRILDPIVSRVYGRGFKGNLARLKDRLEATANG
jgi:uncharacterized membrane protein